ncbi:unnamed protein product [Caenorhabditis sp. 36 PRJEB53466]|nr:unnamed protein product [Caenorhabditis sp. 36 PRJEB53466]
MGMEMGCGIMAIFREKLFSGYGGSGPQGPPPDDSIKGSVGTKSEEKQPDGNQTNGQQGQGGQGGYSGPSGYGENGPNMNSYNSNNGPMPFNGGNMNGNGNGNVDDGIKGSIGGAVEPTRAPYPPNGYGGYGNGNGNRPGVLFDDKGVMQSALEYVDTVFHLAAVGMTGQYAHNRKACMDINAIGTMNLLDWSKQFGVKRFIYTSSIGFYNYYCESKAHAERIVRQASSERMKCSVLRFNGIYGPGEKRVTERVKNFMISGWWIACCKPDGVEAQTQLSSVDNCVHGLLRAEITLRNCDAPHAQIYNIMDPEPVGTFFVLVSTE